MLDDDTIISILNEQIDDSINDDGEDISDNRAENSGYYLGRKFATDESLKDAEGKYKSSTYVTRECFELVEWTMPNIGRVFLSGGDVFTFDAVNQHDEDAAKQETKITQHKIKKGNFGNSFTALYDWSKECLINDVAYLKCYMEEKVARKCHRLTGITADKLHELMQDDDFEVLEQESFTEILQIVNPETNAVAPVPVELFNIKVRGNKAIKSLRYVPVPGSDMIIPKGFTGKDLDESPLVGQKIVLSITEWADLGYDLDDLHACVTADDIDNQEKREKARYTAEHDDNDSAGPVDDSMRELEGYEIHAWMDVDEDGLAEFRRFVMIGGKLFDNDEDGYQPFISMSAIPLPHTHVGLSWMEQVKADQRLGSQLMRETLDNLREQNRQKRLIGVDSTTDDGKTMQAFDNPMARNVPVEGSPGNAAVTLATPSIVGDILPVMAHHNDQRSKKTGVTPEASLDPDVLKDTTFGAFMAHIQQSTQRLEMLQRVMAETGWSKLGLKTHQSLRMHWDIQEEIKIRDNWIPINPMNWLDRTEVTVNVGTGFNSRETQLMLIRQNIDIQKEALQLGLADAEKIYNSLEKMIDISDVDEVDKFYIDPKSDEYKAWQQQQEQKSQQQAANDPQIIAAKSQDAALKAKSDLDARELQHKADMEKGELDLARQKAMAEHDVKVNDQKIAMMKLENERMEFQSKLLLDSSEVDSKNEERDATRELKLAQTIKTEIEAANLVGDGEEPKIISSTG